MTIQVVELMLYDARIKIFNGFNLFLKVLVDIFDLYVDGTWYAFGYSYVRAVIKEYAFGEAIIGFDYGQIFEGDR